VFDKLQGVALHPDIADSVTWRWTADGNFTSATAYAAQFAGAAHTNYIDYIWLIDAPTLQDLHMACGSGLLLHALAQRGWPHNDSCVLCGTSPSPETAQHLLSVCPMTSQVRALTLTLAQVPPCFMTTKSQPLIRWLSTTLFMIPRTKKPGWNSLYQLVFQGQANSCL
jgi:hypothetical protein